MYYILDCDEPQTENGEAVMKIGNTFEVGEVWSWKSGQRFDADERSFDTPIRIPFEPLRGYQGPPVEMRDLGIPIMSERLYKAIVDSGVTNVEWFDAEVLKTSTSERFAYKAYNVVGLVAAADMTKSEWQSDDGIPIADVSFDELVLDETKARGALLFRLAENVNALLVHQRVRDHIEAAGISTVKFMAAQDWMQI